jgi:hypothetical protein
MREALQRFGDTAKFRGIGKPFAVLQEFYSNLEFW